MRKHTLFALACLTGLNVWAQSDTTRLENVVVTGVRTSTQARNVPATVSVVGRETLTQDQRLSILPTLTEQVPGLFVTGRGVMGYGVSGGAAGGIGIRGLNAGGAQVLVLIDGQPQYQSIFGHSISDSYQTLMAEKVEVVRGPASVLYGSNAMGGVINIVTRGMKTNGQKTHVHLGGGSWGTFQGEASNQLRRGKFSSTLAVQYERSDNHRPNMGFEQYGGYVKLGYDLTEHWNLFADANLTRFNASYPGTLQKPMSEADQWITRGVASVGITNTYRRATGRISVYDNFGRHKVNDGYATQGGTPQKELFRSKDALIGVSAYEVLQLMKGNSITVGLDYQHIYGRAYYTSRETGEVVTAGKRGKQSCLTHNNEVAGYVDLRQDVAPWLALDAGLRYDHHSEVGGEWIPLGAVIFRPLQRATLKATVSKGFRNPTTKELYLYGTANRDLQPERMVNYEIAWQHRLLDGALSYGVNLFLMDGDNLIQTINQKNINTGTFLNKGIELEAQWRVNGHWSLNTNHAYLHMKKPLLATPRYKGFLGARMQYGRWTAGAGLQQVTGLHTLLPTKDAEGKQEHFTLLNATVGYQVLPQLHLWVKGDNLLAQRYEILEGMPMPKATFMAGVNLRF